jgi:hypothetical protein
MTTSRTAGGHDAAGKVAAIPAAAAKTIPTQGQVDAQTRRLPIRQPNLEADDSEQQKAASGAPMSCATGLSICPIKVRGYRGHREGGVPGEAEP